MKRYHKILTAKWPKHLRKFMATPGTAYNVLSCFYPRD